MYTHPTHDAYHSLISLITMRLDEYLTKGTSLTLRTTRTQVHETEITTRMLQKICDANPNDVIFRAAHEHAKQLLCAANFDLCQLESLRRTNSAP